MFYNYKQSLSLSFSGTNIINRIKIVSYTITAGVILAIQLLGGKCEFCGEDRFFRLTFHHISDKIENINMNWRWEKIRDEIMKCKLLCRNCHQELHSTEENTIYKISKGIFLEYNSLKQVISLNDLSPCIRTRDSALKKSYIFIKGFATFFKYWEFNIF